MGPSARWILMRSSDSEGSRPQLHALVHRAAQIPRPADDGIVPPDFTVRPHPWIRTGPGSQPTGAPNSISRNLTRRTSRLCARVARLHDAGIYAGVYLFTGEWLLRFRCAGDGYPFSGPNNVNGIDDGGGWPPGRRDDDGAERHHRVPGRVRQEGDRHAERPAERALDRLRGGSVGSTWWNDHLIAHVRATRREPLQHPIGYGALERPDGYDPLQHRRRLGGPVARLSPARSCGTGTPSCKVNINDSDHSYFGMWNDTPQKNRNYAWENFATGNQVVFMDPYVV